LISEIDIKDFGVYEQMAAKTAVYPKERAMEYLSTGMAAEVGEFCGKIAKTFRKDKDLDKEAAAQELGDVMWFVALTCRELGYTMQQVATMNIIKLHDRKERGVLKGDGDYR
jgi:NTP pyrophosphatase (non-canonical NTP hydrolase)